MSAIKLEINPRAKAAFDKAQEQAKNPWGSGYSTYSDFDWDALISKHQAAVEAFKQDLAEKKAMMDLWENEYVNSTYMRPRSSAIKKQETVTKEVEPVKKNQAWYHAYTDKRYYY